MTDALTKIRQEMEAQEEQEEQERTPTTRMTAGEQATFWVMHIPGVAMVIGGLLAEENGVAFLGLALIALSTVYITAR